MTKNQTYIQNLQLEEVPWHRLTTAYGRASDFPEYFHTIWNMSNSAAVKKALVEILYNIEHQSSLWHSTPFAMIFLVHIFEHAIPEIGKNTCADYIIEELLDFFECIADNCQEIEEMEHEVPLPAFADMLQEEYLWSEIYDEEEDDKRYEEGDLYPDDVFYSFWYYSYETLLFCKPLLKKLEDTPFHAKAAELEKMLSKTINNT